MSTSGPTASESLAAVIIARRFEELSAPTLGLMKQVFLDFVGVMLAGSASVTGVAARDFATSQGPGPATVAGDWRTAGPAQAAFANAVSGHSIEFDDIDALALAHYGVAVIPAALAAADLVPTDGRTLLQAMVAGCETMARLSAATNPALRDHGFHTTSACGGFAGAVAAGVVLGISEPQLVNALGLAGGQASGLMEIYGASMQKRFNPGFAARNSVTAALLARAGVTGERTMIDGVRGFAQSFGGQFDSNMFLHGLGTEIPLPIEFKPYACVRPIHAAVDAAISLRPVYTEGALVEVVQHPSWAGYFDVPEPRSVHEAQVSLPYSVALALLRGTLEPDDFDLTRSGADKILDLARRVRVFSDSTLNRTVSGRVRLVTISGEIHTRTVDHALGSNQNPMSEDGIRSKFDRLAVPIVGDESARRIADFAHGIELEPSTDPLSHLLTPAAPDPNE